MWRAHGDWMVGVEPEHVAHGFQLGGQRHTLVVPLQAHDTTQRTQCNKCTFYLLELKFVNKNKVIAQEEQGAAGQCSLFHGAEVTTDTLLSVKRYLHSGRL